jgi:PAS domain S-box-containing protein
MSSIQAKLFAVVAALIVVLVGFLATYFPGRELVSARQTLDDKALTYARLVSKQVESAVAFDDRETVREVFASVVQDPDVRSMALYKSNGALLYALGSRSAVAPPARGGPDVRLEARGGVIQTVSQVVAREGPTGTLVIELAEDRLDDERAQIQRVAVAAGLAALSIGMLGAWAIGRSLARRLGAIAGATSAVAGGDLSVRPVIDRSRDEVGQLARSFGTMLTSIRDLVEQNQRAREEEKEHLDALVRQRTRDLEATMDRYKTLVESTNAVPWELEPGELRFAYVSPQSKRILGKEPAEIVGGPGLSLFVHEDDREHVTAQLTQLARSEQPADIDIEHRVGGADGPVTYVRSIVGTGGTAGNKTARLRGITLDVTAQRKLEFGLRQAQKLESVGRLASGVAHEINTPVQFVSDSVHFVQDAMEDLLVVVEKLSVVQRLVLDKDPLDKPALEAAEAMESADLAYVTEHAPKALERAIEGLGRVATIVRSLKDFAHPGGIEMATVDLNRALEGALVIAGNEYKYVADARTDFATLPSLRCHIGDLNQVILNLIVNAAHSIEGVVKGTGKKGCISLQTRQDGDDVVITVSDTGCGIPPSIQDRVFDPFFTTKEVGKGTGQGLAIARAVVVDQHGGELTFETEVGKGTSFFVRLPLAGPPRHSSPRFVGVAA